MNKNSEEPAFPHVDGDGQAINFEGLTKAEWFAGQALPVMLRHHIKESRKELADLDLGAHLRLAVEDAARLGQMMADLKPGDLPLDMSR